MKFIFFLLLFSITIYSQDTNLPDTNKQNNKENVIDKELQHLKTETDLKIKNLEDKIESNYRELKGDEDLVKERMNLYVAFVLGILGLIAFLINFFGKRAIKDRVENIIQNTIDKYAKNRIDEELEKRITDETVKDLIEEKGKEAIDKLIKELSEEGKRILIDQNKKYEGLLNDLKATKDKLETDFTEEDKNKLKEFKEVLSKVKNEEEYTAADWYFKGNEAGDEKDYDNAVKYYDKVIQLDPSFISAYIERGIAYRRNKKYNEALESYNKAIELQPNYIIAYKNRALVYLNMKEFYKAINDYNKCLEIDKDDFGSSLSLAEIYIAINDISSAEAVLLNTKLEKDNINYLVIKYFLQIIIAVLTHKDIKVIEEKLNNLLLKNPKITWSFDEIEEWLPDCSLSEPDKIKIQKMIELLKKYKD